MRTDSRRAASRRDDAGPKPVDVIRACKAYQTPKAAGPIELRLDGNEGPAPEAALLRSVELSAEALRRYPDARPLQQLLAERFLVSPAQVLVTAGADGALDRACRALLCRGRELVLPVPTFEMIRRYAELTGARIMTVPWPGGDYPLEQVLRVVGPNTAAIAMVSPNNPTGAVARAEQLVQLSAAAPQAVILLDHAYVELADDDLTAIALSLDNVLVFRTLSKAYGLAGLRVGYVLGKEEPIDWLRRSGHPYPVSAVSLALALARLREEQEPLLRRAGEPPRLQPRSYGARVVSERAQLVAQLDAPGLTPAPSQANFVFARGARARWLRCALASLGIAVRGWDEGALADALRITCPGDERAFERLSQAIDCSLRPEALLFDMDGVLVDVRNSYRAAIIETARSYGVRLTPDDIAAAKRRSDSNNDWLLTQRMLRERGVNASLDEVIERFEAAYQGDGERAGLYLREQPLVPATWLRAMAQRLPLAVVTGRPRADAERYLERMEITDCFSAVVCMEDAPVKPDPAPVRLALQRLGVNRAWMLGDTADDIRAAAAAGVVSLGVVAPSDVRSGQVLLAAGGAQLLENASEVEGLLT